MFRKIALATFLVLATASASFAAPDTYWGGSPGGYDRMVNGSDASTPGHN